MKREKFLTIQLSFKQFSKGFFKEISQMKLLWRKIPMFEENQLSFMLYFKEILNSISFSTIQLSF